MSLLSLSSFYIIAILALQGCYASKILELTNKNIGNVLRSQTQIRVLYHHPLCQFSSSYKHQFVAAHQANTELDEIVGVVDCSLEKVLCERYNVSKYPYILKMSSTEQAPIIVNPFLYLSAFDASYKSRDEYKSAHIAELLKNSPHFIVVLFEEEGLPVPHNDQVKGVSWADRVFYLEASSDSNVSKVLAGFVKNMPGCWVYQLVDNNVDRHYCGDAYQPAAHLITTVNKLMETEPANQEKRKENKEEAYHDVKNNSLYDSPDYSSDTIIGHSQLLQLLNNFEHNIEVSTRPRVSMCYYLYLWSDKCSHCSYKNDMSVLNRIIDEHYTLSKDNPYQVLLKHKIHSYNTQTNKLVSNSQISSHFGSVSAHDSTNEDVVIIPDVQAICLATSNNREQGSSILDIKRMGTIIAAQNVRLFVQQLVDYQIHVASKQAQNIGSEL